MTIVIAVKGGCVVDLTCDESPADLRVLVNDADSAAVGDESVWEMEVAVDPDEVIARLEDLAGPEDEAEGVDLSKPCWDIAESSLTPEQEV